MSEHQRDAGPGEQQRIGDATTQLTQDTAALVRPQFDAMRDDLLVTARRAGLGVGLLTAAGVCGVMSVWAVHETALGGYQACPPRARKQR